MNKNRKCILVLFSMLLLISTLEFFEYINVSKLYNDLKSEIKCLPPNKFKCKLKKILGYDGFV